MKIHIDLGRKSIQVYNRIRGEWQTPMESDLQTMANAIPLLITSILHPVTGLILPSRDDLDDDSDCSPAGPVG